MGEEADRAPRDRFKNRVTEHGLLRSVLESFAYIPSFGEALSRQALWVAMAVRKWGTLDAHAAGCGLALLCRGPDLDRRGALSCSQNVT